MKTISLISDVMGSMLRQPKVKTGKVSPSLHEQIEAWPTDYHIKRLIQWHWFLKPVTLGFDFLSAADVVSREKKSGNLASGYLQIGDCPNGDRVYLKESDFSVWYWSHEEATDWAAVESKAIFCVYPTIDLLLMAVINQGFVPRDSCSAREYAIVMGFSQVK
jgi:hypothetical protein